MYLCSGFLTLQQKMKTTRKILRVVEVIFFGIVDSLMAIIGYIILFTITDNLPNWIFYVYAVCASLWVIKNALHRVKWYVRQHPIKMQCPKCESEVSITRYGEERFLKSPVSVFLPRFHHAFNFTGYKILFYKIAYRPYLQLECPECGEKQVVCPYCHEPIQQESVNCQYDKPSKCPHCGKPIYTPVPVQDSEDMIIIGDVID